MLARELRALNRPFMFVFRLPAQWRASFLHDSSSENRTLPLNMMEDIASPRKHLRNFFIVNIHGHCILPLSQAIREWSISGYLFLKV